MPSKIDVGPEYSAIVGRFHHKISSRMGSILGVSSQMKGHRPMSETCGHIYCFKYPTRNIQPERFLLFPLAAPKLRLPMKTAHSNIAVPSPLRKFPTCYTKQSQPVPPRLSTTAGCMGVCFWVRCWAPQPPHQVRGGSYAGGQRSRHHGRMCWAWPVPEVVRERNGHSVQLARGGHSGSFFHVYPGQFPRGAALRFLVTLLTWAAAVI